MPTTEMCVLVLVVLVTVPLLVLSAESLAAVWPVARRRRAVGERISDRARCAVVIPAHDEEAGIADTLASIRSQLRADDLLLVVADNCTDRTAETAVAAGATVIERFDPERRGKAFALEFAFRHLAADPPAVAVVVDADCIVSPGSLDSLVRQAVITGRPAQALYVVNPPDDAGLRTRLSAFAVFYKNVVRPTGLSRMGLPCLLTGTGMAFPWSAVRGFGPAENDLVEDMSLSLALAIDGLPADICPAATVSGTQPAESRTALTQRTRWEHGHMQALFRWGPRLVAQGVLRRRIGLLALALELAVPPLALLAMLWIAAAALAAGLWLAGGSAQPALLAAAGAALAAGSMAAAWFRFARDRLPITSVLAVPFYVAWKIPIYAAVLVRPQQTWVRTERKARSPEAATPGPGVTGSD